MAGDARFGVAVELVRRAEANEFDKVKVHADADTDALPDCLEAVDMADLKAKLYGNVNRYTSVPLTRGIPHGVSPARDLG